MTAEGPKQRILVVDDEPNLLEVLSMALRFQGFAVETANRSSTRFGSPRSVGRHAPQPSPAGNRSRLEAKGAP